MALTLPLKIFQKIIAEQICHIPGVLNISNDVIVFKETQAEHDDHLNTVFHKFAEVNLTLNKHKCEFNKSSLSLDLCSPAKVLLQIHIRLKQLTMLLQHVQVQ